MYTYLKYYHRVNTPSVVYSKYYLWGKTCTLQVMCSNEELNVLVAINTSKRTVYAFSKCNWMAEGGLSKLRMS